MNGSFTSESVTEGHPDKVCDAIADAILDTLIAADPRSRVAVEAAVKNEVVVLFGEITSAAEADFDQVARDTVTAIGYDDPAELFHGAGVRVLQFLSRQAGEIARGVGDVPDPARQGAGDQGMMFGYATDESPELMPVPVLLAHALARGLAQDRRSGRIAWLRPDGKTQVTVEYRDGVPVRLTDVVVSCHHARDIDQATIRDYVVDDLAPRLLAGYDFAQARFLVNPAGSFAAGGPAVDSGLSGRKNIVDTYGGMARHGGGALSGKDPSKVDRSGAYFCRWVARRIVQAGLARRAEIRVAYAIGVPDPLAVDVDTFGTGDERACAAFAREHDFRPAAMIERLELLRPIYRATTNYGHFGKPGLPWEAAAGGP